MGEDKLYSIRGSSDFLGGVSPHTIAAWLSSGKLMRTKVGSRTMIRESELLKVMDDGGKSPVVRRELSK